MSVVMTYHWIIVLSVFGGVGFITLIIVLCIAMIINYENRTFKLYLNRRSILKSDIAKFWQCEKFYNILIDNNYQLVDGVFKKAVQKKELIKVCAYCNSIDSYNKFGVCINCGGNEQIISFRS